jgi:hypothetical protein
VQNNRISPSRTDAPGPNKQILNNIAQRTDLLPEGELPEDYQNPLTRRDVKPSGIDAKKRGTRPISDLFSKGNKAEATGKVRPVSTVEPAGGNQSSIFQYRNPPDEKNRPPPPSYQSAVNSRRSLPGQARSKLAVNKPGKILRDSCFVNWFPNVRCNLKSFKKHK